ncbi:hypothetical protein [Ideonella sp. BN130291]|uniref:hypothetical protein n=1 Tax=Ideonella sp. BN130291 TaxID=3112940 RepID=UPI002E25661B|nr:hypothetical protein [Ideonella sp. BN130291]
MSISIGGLSTATAAAGSDRGQRLATVKQMSQALSQGDLDGAKQAYATMLRNAPEGATWKPDSPFADLGKALRAGDIPAAQGAFTEMVQGARHRSPGTVPPPGTMPVPPVATSSTGGVAGATLNVQA